MSILMGSLAAAMLLAEPPADVEIRRAVVYGTGGGRDLTLDLYLPRAAAAAPRPAMLWFHGGGWRNGKPTQFEPQSIALAAKGFVCASASYRLVDEAIFPAAVEDAKCAMRWLRANAADLGVDPDRIGVGGGSAGGHLSAMVAFTDGFEGEGGNSDVSSRAACYVGYNPVLDVVAMAGHRSMTTFLGAAYDDQPDLWLSASPLHQVAAGAPPSMVFHGDADTTVPIDGAHALMEKLDGLGIRHEFFVAEGQAHGFFNREPWLGRTTAMMAAFVESVLQP